MSQYKYLVSRWADPVIAVTIGVLAYKQWELKQEGPTLLELLRSKEATKQPADAKKDQ